jgi:UDP-N-acetylmuramoyl-L-alanyl-D-glutamate--2,6-diaminopimelate ligase
MLTAGMLTAPADVVVTDVTLDSRAVTPGALFLACRGARHHGIEFAREAVARGASALLFETPDDAAPAAIAADASVFVAGVPALGQYVGTIASRFFGAPSQALMVVGITGTNGKTTCAYLLAQALTLCGRTAAYIGTIGAGLPPALESSTHTTADAVSVQRQLATLKALGAECVAMEVSSHALDQGRVDAVRFRIAAFTNLTHDHLDYHGSMGAYGAAKARLLGRAGLDARIVNVDDEFGRELARRTDGGAGGLIVTSRQSPDVKAFSGVSHVRARGVERLPGGLRIDVESSWGEIRIATPLLGDFNVDNVLTVLAALLAADIPLGKAADAIAACTAPPGRMEVLQGDGAAAVAIVDYAHTPDALAKALGAARMHCPGILRVVFGCGGDRDAAKRPLMGRIAFELADEVVLTDDNPRSEDPESIVGEILGGIATPEAVRIVHDRAAAIRGALDRSRAGDVVLIAGKGHEDYQIYGAQRRAFSDQAVARCYFAGHA